MTRHRALRKPDTGIEEIGSALFSSAPAPLAEKLELALRLAAHPQVQTYITPVPWVIEISPQDKIDGLSESLGQAAKDLYAAFIELRKTKSEQFPVSVHIETTKVPSFQRRAEVGGLKKH